MLEDILLKLASLFLETKKVFTCCWTFKSFVVKLVVLKLEDETKTKPCVFKFPEFFSPEAEEDPILCIPGQLAREFFHTLIGAGWQQKESNPLPPALFSLYYFFWSYLNWVWMSELLMPSGKLILFLLDKNEFENIKPHLPVTVTKIFVDKKSPLLFSSFKTFCLIFAFSQTLCFSPVCLMVA